MKFFKFVCFFSFIFLSLSSIALSSDGFLDFENFAVGTYGECDGSPGNADTTCTYQFDDFMFEFLSEFLIADKSGFSQINNDTQFFFPTYIPELKRGTPEVHPLIVNFDPSSYISLDIFLINSLSPVRVEALDNDENILDFVETSTDGKVTLSSSSTLIDKLYIGTIGTSIVAGFAIDNLKTGSNLNDILDFFDDSVTNGSLIGDGKGNSANGRLNALRNMLEMAGDLIAIDDIEGACRQLDAASRKCDGESRPPDFVTGEAVEGLYDMILELMEELGCE